MTPINIPTNLALQELARGLSSTLPQGLDLTRAEDLEFVETVSNTLYQIANKVEELETLEKALLSEKQSHPLILHLAVKNAKSKSILKELNCPVFFSVVFAVYKEHHRILSQSEHEHGEDFLIRKIAQLDWLCQGLSGLAYELIIVDDGCPEGSGRLAQEIAEKHGLSEKVQVLFLEDAIASNLPVVRPLQSPEESRKGGSIEYGLWQATQTQRENHIVLFTDADLSTHLGQCGLLAGPILTQGKLAAIGSRREENSVVVKQGTRNTRGKLFIYLWKRMLKELNYIVDTQCGFKAFQANAIRKVIDGMIEKQFAFDIELLLKIELLQKNSIEKVGIAWIDSEAASTTTDLQPYLPMLKSVAKMYHHYLPARSEADAFAAFIEDMQEEEWNRLLERVPKEIADRNPAEFDRFDAIGVEDLRSLMD